MLANPHRGLPPGAIAFDEWAVKYEADTGKQYPLTPREARDLRTLGKLPGRRSPNGRLYVDPADWGKFVAAVDEWKPRSMMDGTAVLTLLAKLSRLLPLEGEAAD